MRSLQISQDLKKVRLFVVIFVFFLFLFNKSCEVVTGPGSRFKGKHSLDSDEEDEGEVKNSSKYDILASDDVDGMSC